MPVQKIGTGLVMLSYAVLMYLLLANAIHENPGLASRLTYWPVALACVVCFTGIALALISSRRIVPWATPTLSGMLILVLIVGFDTNPRCLVVLDPHQHGCHTFMAAVLLSAVGLALARKPRP